MPIPSEIVELEKRIVAVYAQLVTTLSKQNFVPVIRKLAESTDTQEFAAKQLKSLTSSEREEFFANFFSNFFTNLRIYSNPQYHTFGKHGGDEIARVKTEPNLTALDEACADFFIGQLRECLGKSYEENLLRFFLQLRRAFIQTFTLFNQFEEVSVDKNLTASGIHHKTNYEDALHNCLEQLAHISADAATPNLIREAVNNLTQCLAGIKEKFDDFIVAASQRENKQESKTEKFSVPTSEAKPHPSSFVHAKKPSQVVTEIEEAEKQISVSKTAITSLIEPEGKIDTLDKTTVENTRDTATKQLHLGSLEELKFNPKVRLTDQILAEFKDSSVYSVISENLARIKNQYDDYDARIAQIKTCIKTLVDQKSITTAQQAKVLAIIDQYNRGIEQKVPGSPQTTPENTVIAFSKDSVAEKASVYNLSSLYRAHLDFQINLSALTAHLKKPTKNVDVLLANYLAAEKILLLNFNHAIRQLEKISTSTPDKSQQAQEQKIAALRAMQQIWNIRILFGRLLQGTPYAALLDKSEEVLWQKHKLKENLTTIQLRESTKTHEEQITYQAFANSFRRYLDRSQTLTKMQIEHRNKVNAFREQKDNYLRAHDQINAEKAKVLTGFGVVINKLWSWLGFKSAATKLREHYTAKTKIQDTEATLATQFADIIPDSIKSRFSPVIAAQHYIDEREATLARQDQELIRQKEELAKLETSIFHNAYCQDNGSGQNSSEVAAQILKTAPSLLTDFNIPYKLLMQFPGLFQQLRNHYIHTQEPFSLTRFLKNYTLQEKTSLYITLLNQGPKELFKLWQSGLGDTLPIQQLSQKQLVELIKAESDKNEFVIADIIFNDAAVRKKIFVFTPPQNDAELEDAWTLYFANLNALLINNAANTINKKLLDKYPLIQKELFRLPIFCDDNDVSYFKFGVNRPSSFVNEENEEDEQSKFVTAKVPDFLLTCLAYSYCMRICLEEKEEREEKPVGKYAEEGYNNYGALIPNKEFNRLFSALREQTPLPRSTATDSSETKSEFSVHSTLDAKRDNSVLSY